MKTKLAQIKAREEKETSCLINPDESSKMLVWDLVTTLALAYTALITPLEIAFFSSSVSATPGVDAWWALNRVVDITFICDMCLQFFIMVRGHHKGVSPAVVSQLRLARLRPSLNARPSRLCHCAVSGAEEDPRGVRERATN